MTDDHEPNEAMRRIRAAQEAFPALAVRIERGLLIALHKRGIATVDDIHDRARARVTRRAPLEDGRSDNAARTHRLGNTERRVVAELTLELAAQHLSLEEIDDIVILQRKREKAQTLEEIANLSAVSFRLLAGKVKSFAALPTGQTRLPKSEAMAVRVALIRHIISDQLEFIGVARGYLRIRDFADLIDRILGDDQGMGRIGGKAAGLLLATRILEKAQRTDPRAPKLEIHTPDSWYLRSDVVERFIEHQGLVELQSHKYKDLEQIGAEYPMIVNVFQNADLPPEITEQLRRLLEEAHDVPLIVRSSSLLEDRFGVSFAGKYRSIFLANQGTVDERLEALIGAVTEVYASMLHPDAISYRRRHHLIDYSENMAILIQRVVGQRYGPYFLPAWSGVAFSRNEFRRNARLRPEDGVARIVFGLGTRAVDRVSKDFPRMVPLGAPTLRPEVRDIDVALHSQQLVDVVNLEKNCFETVEFSKLVTDEWMPGLEDVVSVFEDGCLRRPSSAFLNVDPKDLLVTFDRWVRDTPYPAALRWIVKTLEEAYGQPVDIEWAFNGKHFHLLQCRPQIVRGAAGPVAIPEEVTEDRKIFSSSRDVSSGSVDAIEYVVLVEAADYDRMGSPSSKARIARVVNAVNQRLASHRFILMGPGRWGSQDPAMGIATSYADIDNTRMLIEVARPLGGYVPEPSFGSHFFQDLIETEIEYLALYPEEAGSIYDEEFLLRSPNELATLLPDFADFSEVVRVIHVPTAKPGHLLRVVMDGDSGRALGYLTST